LLPQNFLGKTGENVVRPPQEVVRGAISAVRERLAAVAGQSERTILLGTILLASAVSAVTGFVLAQYYSIDVLSSLVFVPDDCYLDWGMKVGRHCFSDYSMSVGFGMRPNPWEPYPMYVPSGLVLAHNNYPAAGMVPQMIFGVLGRWLGAPSLGLVGYLLVLTIAVLTPAVWAARGARGLERVVVFVACGIAAIPAWVVIDRGNSVGFAVPVALVFLVALCRRRWGLVTIMVVLAALVKPQFALLAVALFAARQWRWGGIAVAGAAISNIAAYVLWPRDFPETITQSIHDILGFGTFRTLVIWFNVSFGKGLLSVPDGIKASGTGGTVPDGFLAGPRSLIGYAVLVLVVVSVLGLGRRIPPVMVGIVLLATVSLFPAASMPYYLVFALPVAALVARDPNGPPGTGIFDWPATVGGSRRAVGVCVSLAAALSIAQIALPSPPIHVNMAGQIQMGAGIVDRAVVLTTLGLTPLLWLITCGAIIVSYARRPRPEPSRRSDQGLACEDPPDTAMRASSTSELETVFSSQRPA
jgi:hypothetical protein